MLAPWIAVCGLPSGSPQSSLRRAAPGSYVLTVGHSNLEPARFIDLLRDQGVELLVDVRRFPGSRHVPWTKSEQLATLLADAGVGYLHLESLGGRRRPVADSPNDGWRVRQFQGYADHMSSDEFSAGLEKLEGEARSRRVAIMCAEAQWWRCHRRLIADRLIVGGWRVLHLDGGGRLHEHELTEFARVEDGSLTYPKATI
ncbi:MAG TPA: DUF488 domain-containing protein [Solirubrobacterales bacterium]|jgi:uncharacterized protein (DUF488 family)|nr:DUF488 domain-containing protein [Solirubrobacterales bacterium]